jgi:uncharacterized protein YjbI with pentapeptide repeats
VELAKGELVDFEGAGISAALIRDFLLDADKLDPRGLRIRNARIEGQLDLRDVAAKRPLVLLDCTADEPLLLDRAQLSALDLTGLAAPAVIAPWMRLDYYLHLSRARLDGGADNHALDLAEANIGGYVNLDGAHLSSERDVALFAPRLRTGSDFHMGSGFRSDGQVRLNGARLGGGLHCRGARLVSANGPALWAGDLQTTHSVFLSEGFHASSSGGNYAAVRIRGGQIGGQLVCRGGRVSSDHLALDLRHVKVGMDLLLPADFVDGAALLDGLSYEGLPRDASLDEWLDLLANRTHHYSSQPYLQLATAHQAAGHERDVRRIRIAQQRDLLRRGRLTRWSRAWHRITGATIGYGYRPAAALLWLLATLAMSIAIVLGIAGPAGVVRCSAVDQIGYALNAATPLVKIDVQQRCQAATTTGIGQLVVVATWILQLLAWAFATLFVAGFTGLVRKNV